MNPSLVDSLAPASASEWNLDDVRSLLSRVVHQHTIARNLTHKRRLENVFLTSLSRLSDHEFLVGAYVPQSNGFINAMRSDANDVTLSVIEIGRQIGLALSHQYLGVGQDQVFVLEHMEFESFPTQHELDWRGHDAVWAHARITDCRYLKDGQLSQVQAHGLFYVGEQRIARQSSTWGICSAERYARLREILRSRACRQDQPSRDADLSGHAASPQAIELPLQFEARVQRPVRRDELWLSQNGVQFIATLQVDRSNLFFFDHENDHVPGMLILEGMRRLALDIGERARAALPEQPPLQTMQVAFQHFAELDAPVVLVANVETQASAPKEPIMIAIEAHQYGRVLASSRIRVA